MIISELDINLNSEASAYATLFKLAAFKEVGK